MLCTTHAGRKLLAKCIAAVAGDANVTEMAVHVQEGNDEAKAFYEKNGFEVSQGVYGSCIKVEGLAGLTTQGSSPACACMHSHAFPQHCAHNTALHPSCSIQHGVLSIRSSPHITHTYACLYRVLIWLAPRCWRW